MRRQSGNVLFLILIAVALFAALSYAVTSSSRSSGGDASKEQTELAAADIVEYGSSLENIILRLRLSGGCSENQISFETPLTFSGYDYTHTPPSPDTCKVFHPAGGGAAYREDPKWYDPVLFPSYKTYASWFTGNYNVQDIGSANSDLVMYLYPIDKAVCNAVNKRLGIIYTGDPPEETSGAGSTFQGVYPLNGDNIGDTPGSVFAGQPAGCAYNSTVPNYYFYKVLLAR